MPRGAAAIVLSREERCALEQLRRCASTPQALARRDSEALLDWIHAHMTQAKYQYHHPWRRGDILLWDNRCLIHSVNMDFPVGQRRLHQRILLAGRAPGYTKGR